MPSNTSSIDIILSEKNTDTSKISFIPVPILAEETEATLARQHELRSLAAGVISLLLPFTSLLLTGMMATQGANPLPLSIYANATIYISLALGAFAITSTMPYKTRTAQGSAIVGVAGICFAFFTPTLWSMIQQLF